MKRILWMLPPLIVLLLCLSGCLFGDVEELLAVPAPPAVYQSLQARIAGEQGEAEAIAPLGGENRQSVQLVDLDGDGRQEAVAFFRDTAAGKTPLRVVIFRQDRNESYHVSARIAGAGNDIASVDYADLVGDEGCEVLVTWQASAAVRSLAAYTLDGEEPTQLLWESCDRYFTGDLDGDGKNELLLARAGEDGETPTRILCWDQKGDGMKKTDGSSLSRDIGEILCWTEGKLSDGSPAVFVTSRLGEGRRLTDILCAEDGKVINCVLPEDGGQSGAVCPDWALAAPADLTGDGITDVPVAVPVPGFGEQEGESFSWLNWRQYRPDGTSGVVLRTCCDPKGDWYLELPADWTGKFAQSVAQRKGESSVMLARAGEDRPFLTIRCLTGEDRGDRSRGNGQILLYAESGRLYTVQPDPEVWDCGMEREDFIEGFHVVN